MQVWLLARDSSSVLQLLQNMSYEGHPALWHLCLYGLSQITHNVVSVQILHLLIALGIVFLIVKFSPFSVLHKFLLSFSYFIFFEYTFISRNYSLGILFLFLFCAAYHRAGKRYYLLATLLALAANTNIYACMISMALALFLGLEALQEGQFQRLKSKQMVISVAIICLGWLLSILQIGRIMLPQLAALFAALGTSNISQQFSSATPNIALAIAPTESFNLIEQLAQLGSVLNDVFKSYVPIPVFSELDFWNTNFLTDPDATASVLGIPLGDYVALALTIALLSCALYFLARRPALLWSFIFGNFVLVAFRFFLHDQPALRHQGHFFILLVICFWLLNSSLSGVNNHPPDVKSHHPKLSRAALQQRFFTVVLTLQFFSGLYAASMDYIYPFSAGKAAANFIQENGLAEIDIFGSLPRQATVLSGYLDVPIYYPQRQEFGSFWTHLVPKIDSDAELIQAIESQANAADRERLVLALTRPLPSADASSLSITELARFEQSIAPNETFYLYLAQGE
ncbi:MAG: hypothetical protein ACFB8W_16170 [Elainellaceae cyanobacterium]